MEEAFLLYCTSSTSILAVRKWVAGKYHLTNAVESTEVARFPNLTVICNWDGGSLGQHLGDLTVNISWMLENGRIRRTSVISGLNMAPPAKKDAIPPTRKQQKYKAKSVSWIRSYPTGEMPKWMPWCSKNGNSSPMTNRFNVCTARALTQSKN